MPLSPEDLAMRLWDQQEEAFLLHAPIQAAAPFIQGLLDDCS